LIATPAFSTLAFSAARYGQIPLLRYGLQLFLFKTWSVAGQIAVMEFGHYQAKFQLYSFRDIESWILQSEWSCAQPIDSKGATEIAGLNNDGRLTDSGVFGLL